MAMDGLNLCASAAEIRAALTGGKIDKIYQPEKDELLLHVRAGGENHKLLLSASAAHGRAQLTNAKRVNPVDAPMFCMLLRRRILSGRIIAVEQPDLDRTLILRIEAENELGDMETYALVCEIMGKHSNIMLLSGANVILDAVRHVGAGVSNVRFILPGLTYAPPPAQDKRNPLFAEENDFYFVLQGEGRLDKALSNAFFGLSPAMAQSLAFCTVDHNDLSALTGAQRKELAAALKAFYAKLALGRFEPCVALNEYLEPVGVYPFVPNGIASRREETLGAALDAYYEQLDTAERIARRSASVRKILQNNVARVEKKLSLYNDAIGSAEETEKLRLFGELITANLHAIKKGVPEAALLNYYEDPPQTVLVKLDVKYSPSDNAQRYFKKYQKAKAARKMAVKQREQALGELSYLEGQLDNLDKCSADAELNELHEELVMLGYVKREKTRQKPPKLPPSKPACYIASDGTEIYVGRNNTQNDYLTLRFASGEDFWLHVKDIPGSHVIVKSGGEPGKKTLYEAALLAAYFSKARNGINVAVDYTPRKYVKKPSGAKPGMVIYTTNKTAYVTPDQAEVKRIAQKR
ncbi:MAG TPA: NFACT RNA binding domain-containing protein [Clostridia bacterium]|nr:NFACT RNA binding domain-containing protein [Clostridia bacterium]